MTALLLDNRRIIITRPEEQAGEMAEELRRLGAVPVILPMIRILPAADTAELDRWLDHLETFDAAVFTSANAVRFTMERARQRGLAASAWSGTEVYAVGSRTARLLEQYGVKVDVVPGRYTGADLARHLSSRPLRGKRILFPRGNLGRDDALNAARSAGADAVPVVVYTTAGPAEGTAQQMRQELLEGPASILVFASPSAVGHAAELFDGEERARLRDRITVAAIGTTTRDAVLSVQWPVHILAGEATADGLVASIAAYIHAHSNA